MCKCNCKGAVSAKGAKGDPGATGAAGSNGTNGTNGVTSVDFSFGGNALPYIEHPEIDGGSFTEKADVIFEGTTFFGAAPSKISIIGRLGAPFNGIAGQVRVRDITNNVTICTFSIGVGGVTKSIYAITSFGAFSTGQAIWELQMLMDGVDENSVRLYSLSIKF